MVDLEGMHATAMPTFPFLRINLEYIGAFHKMPQMREGSRRV